MIEYDRTQQAANKLSGLCPFCGHKLSDIDIHYLDCPKLEMMVIMESYGEEGWPSDGDEMVRDLMAARKAKK